MDMGNLLLGAAILALVISAWILAVRLKRRFRALFGANSLKELIALRETEEQNTPKSLPGATDLYLPALRKDFPELNWPEFVKTAETALRDKLAADGCKNVSVHRTVLSEYRREKGNCYAVLYSAVQYFKEEKKTQARYAVTMGYVQDADKAGYENGVSLCCPRCGAPVKALGEKTCAYCGAAVREINLRVWRVVDIAEK